MVAAEIAPVKPRIISPQSGESVPLESALAELVDAGARGPVCIHGGPGTGKSTALRHLAAVLPPEAAVRLLDTPLAAEALVHREQLTVYAARRPYEITHLAIFSTASWSEDDRIEYLLYRHRDRCASVMSRVRSAEDLAAVGGQPELWSMILDAMALDERVTDFRSTVRRFLAVEFADTQLRKLVETHGLFSLIKPDAARPDSSADPQWYIRQLRQLGCGDHALRILRHTPVQTVVASERVIADLRGGATCWYLDRPLKRELIKAAGRRAARDGAARVRLERLVDEPKSSLHAMAASILTATSTGWTPTRHATLNLSDAVLERACWPGIDLSGVELCRADLRRANLERANLDGALAIEARLTRARLQGASLRGFVASGANLSRADLSNVQATDAKFDQAWLRSAKLNAAKLRGASFDSADLTEACLVDADCEGIDLSTALIKDADFSGANLENANLAGQRLCDATFSGASFERALLSRCNLEFMELPQADFRGAVLNHALLSGSVMPLADFRGAELQSAGLAQIEWEQADLREADLTAASFHLGSTRSGLVFSPTACEGSRTGFYTDEFDEQSFKAPEEIRKANLRGADLRGALVEETDFYLVDLRDARFDMEQERHFRRCGAILETRV